MIDPDQMRNGADSVQNEGNTILCLVRDLLFYSKIRAAAESAGIQITSLRDPKKLVEHTGVGLLVDLNQDHALQHAIDWRARTGRPVIGFVSHVDVETISTARKAGIDQVLARSQFEKNLPTILQSLANSNETK
jgi:hypothetical protein